MKIVGQRSCRGRLEMIFDITYAPIEYQLFMCSLMNTFLSKGNVTTVDMALEKRINRRKKYRQEAFVTI